MDGFSATGPAEADEARSVIAEANAAASVAAVISVLLIMVVPLSKLELVIVAGNQMSSPTPPVDPARRFYTPFYAAVSGGVTRRRGYFP